MKPPLETLLHAVTLMNAPPTRAKTAVFAQSHRLMLQLVLGYSIVNVLLVLMGILVMPTLTNVPPLPATTVGLVRTPLMTPVLLSPHFNAIAWTVGLVLIAL
jgi:hypothetical protein